MSRDPLDEPSGVFIDRVTVEAGVRITKRIELTFRQLQVECLLGQGMMRTWDNIGVRLRLENQRANDGDYREIAPGEGRRQLKPRERKLAALTDRMLKDLAAGRRR